jgi:hypothetical protein
MTASIKRRTFLKRSAALAGAAAGTQLFAAPAVLADPSPNDKLGVAVVGCGGAGGGNPGKAASERLVAMVDIDDKRIAQAVDRIKDKVPNPRVDYDYRKMLDDCHKDIDVVLIATPDHHHAPAAIRAINLGKAKRFTVECLAQRGGSEEKYSQDNIIRWEFPARGDMPPVKVHSYDNANIKPAIMTDTEKKYNIRFRECTLYVGDKGLFRTGGTSSAAEILPAAKHQEFPEPERTLPRAHGGPVSDLFYACKNDVAACSNFIDSAGPLSAFVLTGHLAMYAGVGKKLEWDVEQMQCTNIPEVNRYVRRTYRKGWEV